MMNRVVGRSNRAKSGALGLWVAVAVLILASAAGSASNNAWAENVPFGDDTITTGANGANAVFAADLDGDGDLDVLSASFDDDKIAWYENDGATTPGFTPHTITTGTDGAKSVFAADVDGDGNMDVLSASIDDDKIAWYENDGATPPGFTTRVITTGAVGASSVFAADVDGDGDMDVLSASIDDDKIAWYENDGATTPGFTPHTITTGADGAKSVFAADVDGDGDVDVLSASFDDNKIAWYENDGTAAANFTTTHTITTGTNFPQSVFAADVDGDGDMDVLAAFLEDSSIKWYENDGATPPGFTTHVVAALANLIPESVFAADIDSDGDMDVLAASTVLNTITWHENDGATTPGFTMRVITTGADGAVSIFAADVDGDGDMDVLSASFGDDKIAWYPNLRVHPPTSFVEQPAITTSAASVESVFAADVDRDGDMDVLSASFNDDKIAWYENDGTTDANFTTRLITTGANGATSVFAADVDGDGDMDVLSASFNDNKIAWYENDGTAAANFTTTHTITTDAEGAFSVFAADMDSDGNKDVLSASRFDHKIAWYESDGASPPSFAPHTITTGALGVLSVFAADVDGDGDMDALSASLQDDKIAWYENNGATPPGFTPHTITIGAVGAKSVFAADVDGDGDMDVLSASVLDNKIAWYENDGTMLPGFTTHVITTDTIQAQSVFAADADGDGDMDVISASAFDKKVAWYENDGATPPGFTPHTMTTSANGARSVIAADVDGDGDMDVLSAASFIATIAWYKNEPNRPPDCDAGGPYVAECAGASTQIQLDATASTDPDGDDLMYQWSSDCPSGSFDDDTSATPTLTLNATDMGASCEVTLMVSDGILVTSCTATITVTDTVKPTITLVGANPQFLECPAAYTELGANASDTCDQNLGAITIDATAVVPGTPGDYPVTYNITDEAGNAADQVTRTVTVQDTTDPVITCPEDIEVEPTMPAGAIVIFAIPVATDTCDTSPTVACVPDSGTTFTLGTTTPVTCTATDASGNMADCTFDVKVLSIEEMFDKLEDMLKDLRDGGALNKKNATGFLRNLQSAEKSIVRGQLTPGCDKLQNFVDKLNEFIGDGRLTSEEGQPLVDTATNLMAALGCGGGGAALMTAGVDAEVEVASTSNDEVEVAVEAGNAAGTAPTFTTAAVGTGNESDSSFAPVFFNGNRRAFAAYESGERGVRPTAATEAQAGDDSPAWEFVGKGEVEGYSISASQDLGKIVLPSNYVDRAPNRSPRGTTGGPYVVETAGATTQIQLNATGSSDPDGNALMYQWSSDCENGSFDDVTSATPTLTITGTESGASCSVTLMVSDGIEVASYTTTITVNAATESAPVASD